jgi:hypothetical protein
MPRTTPAPLPRATLDGVLERITSAHEETGHTVARVTTGRNRSRRNDMEETLLGFDVRECWAMPDPLWDTTRRARYLLRPVIVKPLSADPLVWSSVFDTGHGPGLSAAERGRLRLTGVPTPAWIGPNAGLWDDLPRMLATFQHAIPELWAVVPAHTVLAISWLSDAGFSTSGVVGPYAAPTTPATRDERWPLLGYDVGDGSLLSGLMNCGYGDDERDALRAQWGHRLNDAHLFHTAADAFAFRTLSNARTPAHAPFFVYGLYAVADVTGS